MHNLLLHSNIKTVLRPYYCEQYMPRRTCITTSDVRWSSKGYVAIVSICTDMEEDVRGNHMIFRGTFPGNSYVRGYNSIDLSPNVAKTYLYTHYVRVLAGRNMWSNVVILAELTSFWGWLDLLLPPIFVTFRFWNNFRRILAFQTIFSILLGPVRFLCPVFLLHLASLPIFGRIPPPPPSGQKLIYTIAEMCS